MNEFYTNPVGSLDAQGNVCPEQEPLDSMVDVWEISPHPYDSSFDSCIERNYQRAIQLGKDAVEYLVDQMDWDKLQDPGFKLTMQIKKMRLSEWLAVRDEKD